jgi:hypothetical protein
MKKIKPLALNKETLRRLDPNRLPDLAAGVLSQNPTACNCSRRSCISVCFACTP